MKKMDKIKIVLFFCLFIIIFGGTYAKINGSNYVTPESFGAKGDGKSDDSPAISKCLRSGKPIRFTSGKNYLLVSALQHSKSDELRIDGNGAKLTVSEKYDIKENGALFYFGMPRKKNLEVSDLEIDCLLGQKFSDKEKRGDTYIFSVESCEKVKFANVKFKSEKHYNNVTFLRDNGSRFLNIENCRIVINTLSTQGGILWLMNQRDSICSVSIKNSYFEHDAKDECMCFSVYNKYDKKLCKMDVNVEKCEFYSKCESPSSGFILVYSHSQKAYSTINVKYKACSFKTSGASYSRKIQGYQICTGDSKYDYGIFNTEYEDCKFDFDFKTIKQSGIAGILYSKGTSMNPESIYYKFNKCEFKLRNTSPLIDDGNQYRKGTYEFNDCKFETDGKLFVKNKRSSDTDVRIKLTNCDIKSNDDVISTEYVIAKKCRFVNKSKNPIQLPNKRSKLEKCVVNGVKY
jgi:hypothetical protein